MYLLPLSCTDTLAMTQTSSNRLEKDYIPPRHLDDDQ